MDQLQALLGSGIPQNVICHGYVEPACLTDIYRTLDIVLMPYGSQIEVAGGRIDTVRWFSPLKLFEYMSAAKAIVSSDLPTLREVLTNEENALLVPADDVDAWEEALCRLLDDPEFAATLANRAHEDFLAEYTWEARARRVLAEL